MSCPTLIQRKLCFWLVFVTFGLLHHLANGYLLHHPNTVTKPALSRKINEQSFPTHAYVRLSTRLFSSPSTTISEDSNTPLNGGKSTPKRRPKDTYDAVVVGSGVGGLCAAAMLSLYGYKVCVLESHYRLGGAAHGFEMKQKNVGTFRFDTGPSFFTGLNPKYPAKLSNPLRTVLDAIDEPLDCIEYKTFGLKFPEGDFTHRSDTFVESVLQQVDGPMAATYWNNLQRNMKPLEETVAALPTVALRFDVGAALTVGPFLPNFVKPGSNPLDNLKLTKPFQNILENSAIPKQSFTQNWLDLLCFCLSGLPASGTITAEMAMMLGEFYAPTATMDCPKGGAQAIAEALVRGIEKYEGECYTNSHVDHILVENGKASGVRLQKTGQVIKASKAVVSNLSVWDLFGKHSAMIEKGHFSESFLQERQETPVGKSFMHLHVGFIMKRQELEQLQAHYMYVEDWSRGVEAEENAALLSIPSVHDTTLAPDGYGVLHIYTPATEPFDRWENVQRNTPEYEVLKEERSQFLWKILEKVIPDIRERAEVVQIGTPLTHQRFLRRHKGSYGPAIQAGQGDFPFPQTPVPGLLLCGDSCFPGIGIPAVAGSGVLAAHSVSLDSVPSQLKLLNQLKNKR